MAMSSRRIGYALSLCALVTAGTFFSPAAAIAQGPVALEGASSPTWGDVELGPLASVVDEALYYDWGSQGYGVSALVSTFYREDVRGVFKGGASPASRLDDVERCTDLFLAALHRVDDGGEVRAISFDGVDYVWADRGAGHESRWTSAQGRSLVDAMMELYPHEGYGLQIVLLGEGGETHGVYLGFWSDGLSHALSSVVGGSDVILLEDFEEDVVVRSGSGVRVDGQGHTLRGSIECESGSSNFLTILICEDLVLDGDTDGDDRADADCAVRAVNRGQIDPDILMLEAYGCTFRNYRAGAGYLTNAADVTLEGCRFADVSSGPAADGAGALVLDLMNLDSGTIAIRDSSFEGTCGTDAVIGVAVRGGESDEGADGILPGTATTLERLVVSGCSFSCDGAPATVRLGVDGRADEGGPGADGFAANGTGAFAVEVSGNRTGVSIVPAYRSYRSGGALCDTGTGAPLAPVTLGAGGSASKAADGDLVVTDPGDEPEVVPGVVANPDGSTTTTAVGADGSATATTVTPGGSSSVVVTGAGGEVRSVTVDVSAADAAAGPVALPLPGGAPVGREVEVSVPAGGATVVMPVAGGGEVPTSLVLAEVSPDGSETVLPKTAAAGRGLEVSLEGDATLRVVDRGASFPDMTGSEWYALQGVSGFVTSRGIMGGAKLPDGSVEFRGDEGTDRAMFATMLHRLELEPPAAQAPSFGDVSGGDWFAAPAAWASSAGIVTGYPDGRFGGSDPVTREQMAVMLHRYAGWLGLDASARAPLSFPDAGEVSGFARDAMSWAVAEGLFSGSAATGELSPGAGATRAEAATVVMRFVNNVLY